jgi:signal transduction histidine kinase/ActR/RegA family two-component response regulator
LSREIFADAGLAADSCADLGELCREIEQGVGAILLTDATLSLGDPDQLARALRVQPPWSDIPVILLSPRGPDSPAAVWAMNALNNVTVLEQPVRVMTLVSTLRTAVAARVRQYELRDRLDALRQSDRQKDVFLATLSHELRNPLAPIRNALHVLRLAGADPETRARVMDTMERQVGNVIRLVDDLLQISRINEGRIELRRERVQLSAVVRNALESSAPLIEAAGQELNVSLPTEPVLLDADPLRITQVIANLLNNAAKYTEKGGNVWLTARRDGPEAVISVRDTGIGIPADMLTRVFGMFVQVEPSGDRSRQGLGIGLTLVQRLVEMHGGHVEAHSGGLGQGSEFIVRLPAQADRRSAIKEPDRSRGAEPDRRGRGSPSRRILIVDDHHDSADSLGTLLRLLGHDVRVVYDGEAALALSPTFRPEVVLLDIGLPGIDGYEVAVQLRRMPGLEQVLIVALTGYGRDEDRRRSREAGFDSHLIKPVDVPALNAVLKAHAGTAEQGQFAGASRRVLAQRRDSDTTST